MNNEKRNTIFPEKGRIKEKDFNPNLEKIGPYEDFLKARIEKIRSDFKENNSKIGNMFCDILSQMLQYNFHFRPSLLEIEMRLRKIEEMKFSIILSENNNKLLSENKKLLSENKNLISENKNLACENKSLMYILNQDEENSELRFEKIEYELNVRMTKINGQIKKYIIKMKDSDKTIRKLLAEQRYQLAKKEIAYAMMLRKFKEFDEEKKVIL